MAEVPLYTRDGTICAWALVDDADFAALSGDRWHRTVGGYAARRHGLMHRQIMGLKKGDPRQVDHLNRRKLDNRRVNLRVLPDQAAQTQNLSPRAGVSSRFRGVSWFASRRKWRAYGHVDGRFKALGYFDREEDAAEAARAFRAEHMPYSEEAQLAA